MFPSDVSNGFFHLFWSGHFFWASLMCRRRCLFLWTTCTHGVQQRPCQRRRCLQLPGQNPVSFKVSVLRLPMASHGFPWVPSFRLHPKKSDSRQMCWFLPVQNGGNRPLPALPLCRTSTWTSENRGSCRLWVDQNSRSVSIASLLLYKEPHCQTLFTILHTWLL